MSIPGFPASYLLEVQRGGELQSAIALGYVMRMDRAVVPSHTTTYTLGKMPVREHAGNRYQTITLTGRSGLASRRQYRVARNKAGRTEEVSEFATGPELFRELSRFLESYEEDAKRHNEHPSRIRDTITSRSLAQRVSGGLKFEVQTHVANVAQQRKESGRKRDQYRLVFRGLDERLDVLVEVLGFNWTRSAATSRHSYEWSLALQGYAVAEALEKPFGVLGTLADQAKAIAKMVNQFSNAVTLADDAVSQLDHTLDAFKEPLRSISKIGGALGELANSVGSVAAWPLEMATTGTKAAEDVVFGVHDLWVALGADDRARTGPVIRRIVRGLRDAATAARVALMRTGNAKLARNWDPTAGTPVPTTYHITDRRVVKNRPIKAGESLQDIAEEALNDRDLWDDILKLSGLHSPFLSPDGAVLQPGTTLVVPVPPTTELTENEIEDLFGTDLRLDFQFTNEGLQVDLLAKGTEDIQTITGPANLDQALTLRLLTRKGDNTVFPSIGLPQLVGEATSAEALGHFAAHVRTQLLSDPRIVKLHKLDIADIGDGMTAYAELEAFDGSSRPVTVPS